MNLPNNPKPVFLLVDGHSLAFRSYYAFAYRGDGGLRTSTGIPTSVCFGFLKSLLEILDREQPQAVAIAFDLATPTFRHEADDTYKAGRAETPEDFIPDLANLQSILEKMNLPAIVQAGFEADDVIGTLSQQGSGAGYAVKILSGDQDMFQLIDADKSISVLHLGQKDRIQEFHAAEVKEKLGILPTQVIDYKALCGDSSDNIPGVRGIGQKTATKLLEEYGSLERILASVPTMKGAVKQKLELGVEAAKHSQFMATIKTDVPLGIDIETCKLTGFDTETLVPLLQTLELKAFVNKVDRIQSKLSGDYSQTNATKANKKKLQEVPKSENLETDDELWFDFASIEAKALADANAIPKEESSSLILEVEIINSRDRLEQLRQKLETLRSPVAWDTETTSLNPHDADLVGIGCCWGDAIGDVAYIPIAHTEGQNLELSEVVRALKPLLEDPDRPKVLQNAKFDRLMFKAVGIELAGVVFDTMLASYAIDPEASHSLDAMSREFLDIKAKSFKELVGKRKSIAEVAIPEVAQYCGMDTYTTFKLMPILEKMLAETPALQKLFAEVELPLEAVLAEMEWTGIRIDKAYFAELSQELETDLDAIALDAYAQVGREFNLNSPKQLSEILLEILGEKFTKKTRKSNTGYSTDVTVLEKLQGEHPLIDVMLKHRTLAKLKSTYVDALPAIVHPKTGRVHTDYNQTRAATGRLSSNEPNLQNIPIRTAFSRRIRAGFLPEAGWMLVSADYSQIELRILAHLSQEPELVRAYSKGEDVHTRTAQLLLEKEQVSSEERRLAKIINYGVIYGMGAQKFSREAGVSVKEAKQFIDAFNQRYASIASYMENIEAEAEANGFVTTILGRRRYFHDIKRMDGYRKAALLRSAVNAPIQGTSADIIKIAMIRLHKLLQSYEARLLLQVHDELVFEIPPQELEILLPQIKSIMESALELSVPLVVDIHTGANWMAAK
ncbi:DNA polymerase I [Tumidithrix elongata RA019]|uniref:DNA polymerase I n=1 Tax=Tumidithrix elongata BACA0141 TaxID=2716417 RepID=A0AAW9Q1S1_9CYAN|nr:DNA polymerase I [Tumidithrix elongata RA019]